MFDKVLIANRGAIACRVIRTLRRMGVKSVAVFSDADRHSRHVSEADEAVRLGPAPASESYLRVDLILDAAKRTGAQAIHPGYGFLSENADFAEACAAAGIAFIGPTPAQMRDFGLKHTARALALAAGVPLSPGSDLLPDLDTARAEAARIGYPVMLKSTAGGGGIGMQLVRDPAALDAAYASVQRLATSAFKSGGMFLEKYIEQARHIEVQIFGDGRGNVVALGERDCSLQRRNQKVVEEAPAPGLSAEQRARLHRTAADLGRSISYQSAGTVEFVYDVPSGEFYFLEVNTRLQVEHGVTEQITGIDLVEWMVKQAAGELDLAGFEPSFAGHSIQARLYAEDPARNFQPSSGLLTDVAWADAARIETWVERGSIVPPNYDPMIAKIIVTAADREAAIAALGDALAGTRIGGIETNLGYLRAITASDTFARGEQTTRWLGGFAFAQRAVEVLEPGVQTTVQDWPGRLGYWDVGMPPSGPMDDLSLRIANRLVGNHEGAAALEITMAGPVLRFHCDARIALAGAAMEVLLTLPVAGDFESPASRTADLNSAAAPRPLAFGQPHDIPAGSTLAIGRAAGAGARAYLAIAGAIDVPDYLGSKSTFTLGQVGGHGGRALRTGDMLHLGAAPAASLCTIPPASLPELTHDWEVGIFYGPHGAPDFFTDADIDALLSTDWEIHYNSSRTGVRLIGPRPEWARRDGGEAGLHPSNIHDNAYAIGSIDFTGDMPVLLGPDGPSLGGFVCPGVVAEAELWKLGQLRPGDRLRFRKLTPAEGQALFDRKQALLAGFGDGAVAERSFSAVLDRRFAAGKADVVMPESAGHALTRGAAPADSTDAPAVPRDDTGAPPTATAMQPADAARAGLATPLPPGALRATDACDPVLLRLPAVADRPAVTYRRAGDLNLLVEYGPLVLDLDLRFRAHVLMQALGAARAEGRLRGIVDLTPGIRSLQVHYDPEVIGESKLLDVLLAAEAELPGHDSIEISSRIVHLPLAWDDSQTQLATRKYMQSVRKDAPWCPSNIEFIRRINGLESIDEVKRIVYDASYLVLGLGDVYLGAPVATPVDPRHRLVTTKYNPARTWTPENAVGIGGAYMCIYGMEGPGGYQFVGRTLPIWNRWKHTPDFRDGKPWLLRFFDRIRYFEVSEEELLDLRDGFLHGRNHLRIEDETFRLADYRRFLADNADSIGAFKTRQQAAFDAERERWRAAGQAEHIDESAVAPEEDATALPPDVKAIASPVSGSVWKLAVEPGQRVSAGDTLVVVESMKMEFPVAAPVGGSVTHLLCHEGAPVQAGQNLVGLRP
ncbi:5-oxoprolinase/urea amidolyase family protein [Derxia gummosa]|uniref:5-oxoprolinase/urea amidolyase family protein n=1 Tax=Derxia gummosa DSM 723 TaxID=1121388 RepID=A0A8B6X495_9BURK|nr:5-oxoprolinase/urea amidolyase family protein [Derxia gummosa]